MRLSGRNLDHEAEHPNMVSFQSGDCGVRRTGNHDGRGILGSKRSDVGKGCNVPVELLVSTCRAARPFLPPPVLGEGIMPKLLESVTAAASTPQLHNGRPHAENWYERIQWVRNVCLQLIESRSYPW